TGRRTPPSRPARSPSCVGRGTGAASPYANRAPDTRARRARGRRQSPLRTPAPRTSFVGNSARANAAPRRERAALPRRPGRSDGTAVPPVLALGAVRSGHSPTCESEPRPAKKRGGNVGKHLAPAVSQLMGPFALS